MRALGLAVRTLGAAAIDLLFPPRCVACGRFGPVVCDPCLARCIPALGAGRCQNCAGAWTGEGNCPRCYGWLAIDRCLAAVEMTGTGRRVVHGLKYQGIRPLAAVMASAMAEAVGRAGLDCAFAIPLHPSRIRRRGFNQADLVLERLAFPSQPGRLRRTRKTRTQVGLHLRARKANVAGAFAYEGPSLRGLRVALVDDVVTSGATADECATILKEAGAREVIVLAYARTSYDPSAPPLDA